MTQPTYVAIPIEIWAATLELLVTELPMKKVEALVAQLRKAQQLDGLAKREDPTPASTPDKNRSSEDN